MSPSALEGKGQEKLDGWILVIVIKLRYFVRDVDSLPHFGQREKKKAKSGPEKVFLKNTFTYVCICMHLRACRGSLVRITE